MATKKIKNSVVLTARDMLNGYIAGNAYDYNIYNLTPLQMIPQDEKDEDWKKWNLDWLERTGMTQLSKTQKPILKKYAYANAQLDKNDYVIGDSNEFSDYISLISADNASSIPIKFYPIIPNVVNILCGEFSKRDNRILVKAVDDTSKQEMYDEKMQTLTDILVQQSQQKQIESYKKMGVDVNSLQGEEAQQASEKIDAAKAMAEAEVKFKNYRGIAEEWANHMIELDNQRFDMYEKEYYGFRDMLVADREFWHIRVKEDDYDVELWEPWTVFYHKSPSVQYTSEGNFVGRIMQMSIADVIDVYGVRMTEEQLLNLKNHYKNINSFPMVTSNMSSQENLYTDYSKPYPQNYTNVTWQKYMDSRMGETLQGKTPNPISNMTWFDIDKMGGYIESDITGIGMVRVTEAYWKSQKRAGHLTRIDEEGILTQDIVDENYDVTFQPVYDLSLNKTKSKENLKFGEHIDWIWINEVRWGVKFNSVGSSYYTNNRSDFEPVYIGGDPIPFQFKGTNNIYGCKLPVEGKIFSERGSMSSSMVDKMLPNQINFNIVNNQIVEMLADEIGNVLVLDQNMIPRNSMNQEWGKHNYPKFHQVMKDYNIAAIDPSIRNTESATNFAHFQSVDLTKTNQILSRMKLAEYFKNEAFSVVGITPQRLGEVTASESATGTQQAVNNSYAQTEVYFEQHMNHLMPRVRQMMLDAAQYITATKPNARITYLNSDEETVFFQIEGDKLLLRDFKIKAASTANVRNAMEQLRQLALQNNTAGGSLYEIAQVLSLKSPSEIISKLREIDNQHQQQVTAQQQHEQQMQQMAQQHEEAIEKQIEDHDDYWKDREMQKDIYIAEITALGRAKDQDLNADGIPDPLELREFMHQQGIDANNQFTKQQEIDLKRQQFQQTVAEKQKDRALKRDEMQSREKIEKEKVSISRMQKKKASK